MARPFGSFLAMSNWPFAVKLGSSPAIAVLALVGLVAYGAHELGNQSALTRAVVERNLAGAAELSDLAGKVQAINGGLYRLMTLQAAKTEGLAVAAETTKLTQAVDAVTASLADYRDHLADAADKPKIDQLIDDLTKYRGAVEVVASMLEMDFGSAVTFVKPFDDNYKSMVATLGRMVEQTVSEARQRADQAAAEAEQARRAFITFSLLMGVLVTGLAVLIGRQTVVSISRIAAATLKVARGDLAVDIAALTRKDELGAIVDSLGAFKENAEKIGSLQEEREAERVRAEMEKRTAMREMADEFERQVAAIAASVGEAASGMLNAAQNISEAAEHGKSRTAIVADASVEASQNLQQIAEAMSGLSNAISEIGVQVTHSSQFANSAVDEVERTDGAVRRLTEAAEQIGTVVKLIADIAGRTNLLALNATIESARAGEHGKGFAVVASEVKSLANQTARATDEIRGQIAAVQNATNEAIAAIQSVGKSVRDINGVSGAIAAAVEEQRASTQEMDGNLQRVAQGSNEVTTNVTQLEASAGQTQSAATQAVDAASVLASQADHLKMVVNRFLNQVRAA